MLGGLTIRDIFVNIADQIMTIEFSKNEVDLLRSFSNEELNAIADKIESLLPKPVILLNWSATLMYKHRGWLRPKFLDLGVFNGEMKPSKEEATISGQKWISENFQDNEIEEWQVRISPSI